ncbi:hypothetical protein IL306_010118 [Fusarium sp. DS 682]|nr:hypothetical protein IL306_010118 [Fusarium sp. DS 682]
MLYCFGDVEAQEYPRGVLIESSEPNPVLTEALQRPGIIQPTANFPVLESPFAVGYGAGQAGTPYKALYIKNGLNLSAFYTVFATVLIAAVVAGILVGILSGNAKDGLATINAVMAVVSAVTALILWRFKT